MRSESYWQTEAIDRLSALLRGDDAIRALVLTGSLARTGLVVDEWSDVDAKVILSDDALDRYDSSPDWLSPLGSVVGFQRISHGFSTTLRICLERFRRFDITLIPEPALAGAVDWPYNPFLHEYRVLWSDIPGLEEAISSIPHLCLDLTPDEGELRRIADQFWFKAAGALARVVRNDLLVALHDALDLARDCLRLQMVLRDREIGTNMHREGSWGNDIVQRLYTGGRNCSPEEIVEIVASACRLFDELAPKLCPGYSPRFGKVATAVERARDSAGRGLSSPNDGA